MWSQRVKPTAKFEKCRVIRESDSGLALLIEIDGKEIWVPKSVIDEDSEVWEDEQEGELVVYEWWAEDKGLV